MELKLCLLFLNGQITKSIKLKLELHAFSFQLKTGFTRTYARPSDPLSLPVAPEYNWPGEPRHLVKSSRPMHQAPQPEAAAAARH
jgi:hypothetical protein